MVRAVFLKVGGIAPLGAISRSKEAKKLKGELEGQNTQRGRKCSTTNRSLS